MRGSDGRSGSLSSYVDLESRVRADRRAERDEMDHYRNLTACLSCALTHGLLRERSAHKRAGQAMAALRLFSAGG